MTTWLNTVCFDMVLCLKQKSYDTTYTQVSYVEMLGQQLKDRKTWSIVDYGEVDLKLKELKLLLRNHTLYLEKGKLLLKGKILQGL